MDEVHRIWWEERAPTAIATAPAVDATPSTTFLPFLGLNGLYEQRAHVERERRWWRSEATISLSFKGGQSWL